MRYRHSIATLTLSIVFLSVSVSGCGGKRDANATVAGPGVPEESIGLVHGRLEQLPPLAPVPTAPGEPGEVAVVPPAYLGAPPVVPHAIDEFVPIGREDNVCLGCHQVETAEQGEPTPVPASHYEDLRNDPGRRQDDVAGARWVCISCHVAATDAAPLVDNVF